jgi:hypothetical protein
MTLPQETSTIEEFIESGYGVTITYPTLSFTDMLSNGTWVSVHNVINDYIEELRNACVNVELNSDQQFKYFYKPKLLCHDMYGNPELYFIILLINDMADVKEFTKPVIKMLRKSHMSEVLTLIYNTEKKAIEAYSNK